MPIAVPIEQIAALPEYYLVTIPPAYIDLLGHMNVRYYFEIYGGGAMGIFGAMGMSERYIKEKKAGNFVLRQIIDYIAEVLEGDTVSVRARVLGRSERRIHVMYFMFNETRQRLASTSEVLVSYADLSIRRTAPWPAEFAERIDALVALSNALDWDAPVSGAIGPQQLKTSA